MESEFYSIKETAVIFNVHVSTIRRAVKLGYIIAIRMGLGPKSPYRISKKQIEAIHKSIIHGLAAKAPKGTNETSTT
jgi:excisionase family DNA binding protein